MADPVPEACHRLVRMLGVDGLVLDGSYEAGTGTVKVSGLAPESAEVHERLLEIALDVFQYLDGVEPAFYEFELQTLAGEHPGHRYRMATAVEAMLPEGELTRDQWATFVDQLEFTRDGLPLPYPEPDAFSDD